MKIMRGKKPSQFGLRRQCKQWPLPPGTFRYKKDYALTEIVINVFDDVLSKGST